MRTLLIALLLTTSVHAGVTCMEADDVTPRGTWTLTGTYYGTCSGATGRGTTPIHYVIINDHSNTSTAQADELALGALMQKVFDDAWLGDKIVFTAGQTFSFGSSGPHITKRQGDTTKLLTVTTTQEALLPPDGTRITPAYIPLMATIVVRGQKSIAVHGTSQFFFPSGPGAAEHIDFHGLVLKYESRDDSWQFEINGGVIFIGGMNKYSGNNNFSSVVSSAAVLGATVINVVDTTNFAVTTPRQKVAFNFSASSLNYNVARTEDYTVEAVSTTSGAGTITICRATTNVFAEVVTPQTCDGSAPTGLAAAAPLGSKVFSIQNRSGDSVRWAPNDIRIRHCINNNPIPRINTHLIVNINGSRSLTVTDNWFGGIINDIASEPKYFGANGSVGPHLWTNNFFLTAGMTIMYGGSTEPVNAHLEEGATWRYNMLYAPFELTNLGPPGIDGWVTLTEGGPYVSLQSVAGLAPHSPRFVIAGRCWTHTGTGGSNAPFWCAVNSGVVDTVHPTIPGTLTNNTYMYSGDASRGGTTVCGGVTYAGDGVCFRYQGGASVSGGNHLNAKNSWETKNSEKQLFEYNVVDGFAANYDWNSGQSTVFNMKTSSSYYGDSVNYPGIYKMPAVNDATQQTGCFYDITAFPTSSNGGLVDAGYSPWPFCARSSGYDFTFRNNWLRNIAGGGWYAPGYYNPSNGYESRGTRIGKWRYENNFVGQIKPPFQATPSIYRYACWTLGANSDDRGNAYRAPITNIVFSHNTCYSAFNTSGAGAAPLAVSPVGVGQMANPFQGYNEFSGNIIGRGGSGTFARGNYYTDGSWVADWFPFTNNTALGTKFGRNVLLGAAAKATATTFPTDSVYTGCTNLASPPANGASNNVAPCYGGATGATAVPDYTKVFVNVAGGDYRVQNSHLFAKRGDDGKDLGADPTQLAMIMELTVTPTDRSVVFQYRLTQPILDIPCVVELHSAPDLESTTWGGVSTGYAAELSNIATYHGREVDNYNGFYRDGNRRMVLLGTSVALTAATPYYYRLHCGGDSLIGTFTTLATQSGSGTQTVARTAVSAATADMIVEYGTAYDRSTNTISGGGTSSPASCTVGTRCVATFSVTKGVFRFYRWKERDAAGTPNILATGKVEVMPSL